MGGHELHALVVGAGVAGLTTAIALADQGWAVEVQSLRSRTPTSAASCALFLPYFGTVEDGRLGQWANASWRAFERYSQDPASGVSSIQMMELFRTRVEAPATLTNLTSVVIARRDDLPKPYEFAWEFKTWLIDAPIYLPRLRAQAKAMGVHFVERKYDQAAVGRRGTFRVIINCTGHWTRTTFGDSSVEPVRGQTVVTPPSDLNFAVGADDFLLAPRSDGLVVGSLWQVGDASPHPRQHDTVELLMRASTWFASPLLRSFSHRLSPTEVQLSLAGARPFRSLGPKVAVEDVVPQTPPLIHNTGHGGSGVALSWGAAQEVVSLVGRYSQ